MTIDELKISKLRIYLINEVIDKLVNDKKYQLNANMLSNDINNYSLDKIPTKVEEKWIIGVTKTKEVYQIRGRLSYGEEAITNLKAMGFFEQLENLIEYNNKEKILPDIENIEKIECLNPGTMISNDDGSSAEFQIQIQITYRKNKIQHSLSL